jgi:hypothetical protein
MAKQMLTAREAVELRAFYRRYPFDDESTQHVPAAQLAAMYANSHRKEGADAHDVDEFLIFQPRPEPGDEAEMDADIIKFFEDL